MLSEGSRVIKPLSSDTTLSVEYLWIAGLREKGPLWRLQRLASMTSFCWQAAHDAFQGAMYADFQVSSKFGDTKGKGFPTSY
jgi:hypothetical protein